MELGSSVRLRLTLWNVGRLALALGGFGSALCFSAQGQQYALRITRYDLTSPSARLQHRSGAPS